MGASALALAPAATAVGAPVTERQADEVSKVARGTARDHARAMTRNVKLHRENAELRGIAPKRDRVELRDWTTPHVKRDGCRA
jgi:hypothetical protein